MMSLVALWGSLSGSFAFWDTKLSLRIGPGGRLCKKRVTGPELHTVGSHASCTGLGLRRNP
jgi:hypothetical protein